MPVGEMLPAVAQGAIGVETRNRDDEIKRLLVPLNDKQTAICVAVERAFLAELDGSCRTPIAGLAEFEGDELTFRGIILRPDGSEWHETAKTGRAGDAVAIGREAAVEVRGRVTADFFSDVS
jgi:hydroxymethylbilane synthase